MASKFTRKLINIILPPDAAQKRQVKEHKPQSEQYTQTVYPSLTQNIFTMFRAVFDLKCLLADFTAKSLKRTMIGLFGKSSHLRQRMLESLLPVLRYIRSLPKFVVGHIWSYKGHDHLAKRRLEIHFRGTHVGNICPPEQTRFKCFFLNQFALLVVSLLLQL